MQKVQDIIKKFRVYGDFVSSTSFGSGHINETFLVTLNQAGIKVKYILRSINNFVFKEPILIIENTVNVTEYIRNKLLFENESDLSRKVLTLIQSTNGDYFFVDSENNYWCLLLYIEKSYSINEVQTEVQAFEAAKAYARFQKHLIDFDISECHQTIKNFHNLTNRIEAYNVAVNSDSKQRVKSVSQEILEIEKFSFIQENYIELKNKNLPLRITHNDTKINNVLLDSRTNKGLCVVDLDTIMPGVILNDFGDMVRSFVCSVSEDEKITSKVKIRLRIFDALVRGYLGELKESLIKEEILNLVTGSEIIIYEQALRFLTDYLMGDIYYKIEYENQNLDRAKNQLALLNSIVEYSNQMQSIVNNIYNSVT